MSKNVFILPTDKPSRLHLGDSGLVLCDFYFSRNTINTQNIYITSDEEIKFGDWCIKDNEIFKFDGAESKSVMCGTNLNGELKSYYKESTKKIILTTDQDLIADGVQTIDDEFLQWFVKNPICEEVEVGYGWIRLTETNNEGYWVSIPNNQFEMQQEEPKQAYQEEQKKLLNLISNLEKDEAKQDLKEIFYDYTYRNYFLAKMKDDSLVVIFKAYGKSSPLQDEFENLIDINTISREANGKEYYDYFTQRGVKTGALCSRWGNEFKPIYKFLESENNYDPQPIIVTLGHSKRYPNGHGMSICNYTFDFKNNSLLSEIKEEPKQETLEEAAERLWLDSASQLTSKKSFIRGAKWQQEQDNKMYSEEEVEDLIYKVCGTVARLQGITLNVNHIDTAYKKFKKK
jgi:hypothetical protein